METKKFRILALAVGLFSLGALFLLLSITGPVQAGPLLQEPPEEPGEDEEVEGAEVLPATVVESAFTYQGRLTDSSGTPLSGEYDFEVELYNGPDPSDPGITQVGATIAVTDVVSNGLFDLTLPVTHGDFNGQGLYLRMRVQPSGGTWDDWTGTQPILPVPYALSLRPGATIGGSDAGNGMLWLRDTSDRSTLLLNGLAGILQAGASGQDGDLFIASSAGNTALQFDGDTAELTLGTAAGGNPGDLIIRDNAGNDTIRLDGNNQSIRGGLHGNAGDLRIDSNDDIDIYLDANNDETFSYFQVYRDPGSPQKLFEIKSNGDVGADGTFLNNDFDYADMLPVVGSARELEPGDVLVISKQKDFAVELSRQSFDTSVIGIYSTDPGFLGGSGLSTQVVNGVPVAMAGVVPCKVSAENGPIQRGDLLTTSSTPGYAMRAGENPAPGTVLGKAMGELEEGTGTIEVLVTLQ